MRWLLVINPDLLKTLLDLLPIVCALGLSALGLYLRSIVRKRTFGRRRRR